MSAEQDPYDIFADRNLGFDLLRAEVAADGGFEGLFELFRQPENTPRLLAKYGDLLATAVTTAEREANMREAETAEDGWVEHGHARVRQELGFSHNDAAAYVVARVIHRTAFPEEYQAITPEQD